MLELLLDGEVIKFVQILEEPEVVMESLALLILLHHLANVEEIKINCVHVHILAFVLLRAKIRLLKRRLEHVAAIVLNSVPRLYYYIIMLFELLSQLLSLIVKILPNDITGLLLLRRLQSLLAFDNS